jgi:ATP-dependent helicase/nuclease subunit B
LQGHPGGANIGGHALREDFAAEGRMIPLISTLFAGATLTEHDDLAPGAALLGKPVWGHAALLANLELRLGLPTADVNEAVRVQRWSRRLGEIQAAQPRFYSESSRVDPLGTATALLAMRDELVAAGWNGEAIPGASERLGTFVELEAGAELRPGTADRVRCVEDELRRLHVRPVDELRLAEPLAVWPARWRRVFALLEELGVPVREAEVTFAGNGDTDLARVQALLRGNTVSGRTALKGDGSLVVLRAETSSELAHALAALLRQWNEPSSAILRGGEAHTLDEALVAQGLPSTGVASASAWRPAAQVLPLAIELAFEPRDPYRVLELLTLPIGPFEGVVGRELASALSDAPGIGGPPWQAAKEKIAALTKEDAEAKLARVAEWLETPGHKGTAPRAALLAVAARVCTWLQTRLALKRKKDGSSARVDVLGAAFAQAQAFHEALGQDPREDLDLVGARLLVEQVSGSLGLELSAERAGRIDPVGAPAGLRVARDLIVWWHCVSGTEWRPSARPWRRTEIAALSATGVALLDPTERLVAEAKSWRQVVLAARKRMVLAMPRWAAGEALEPHPIWDEIVARLGASDAERARVTIESRALLQGRVPNCTVDTVDRGPLSLPEARAEWTLDGANLPPSAHHSASSLESLVGCPLRWVLNYRAGLRVGSIASLPGSPMLEGSLGHRLVESLHSDGGLQHSADLAARLETHLERLLREEASVLLRAGMTFELTQLRKQLATSVTSLVQLIAASGLSVVDVESEVVVSWRGGELEGRLDLLLHDSKGCEVIIDLKWGGKKYGDLLAGGQAVQLAVYSAARRLKTGAKKLAPAGYFSLSRGELFTLEDKRFAGVRPVDGPPLEETWDRLERTVERVEASLAKGSVPVTGVRSSLPLLDALRVPKAHRDRCFEPEAGAACTYCSYSALCGREWEDLT